jgi:hypothetical protein
MKADRVLIESTMSGIEKNENKKNIDYDDGDWFLKTKQIGKFPLLLEMVFKC